MIFFYMNPILIAAAIIPAIFLLVKVYKADRLEREPPLLLLSLVLYGIIATGLAMVTERLGSFILNSIFSQNTILYNVMMYFIVVAFSEEGFKYLLLKKRTWYSLAFNCQFDGVVYATFVWCLSAIWQSISDIRARGAAISILQSSLRFVTLCLL